MLFVILGIILGLAIMCIGDCKGWWTSNTACIAVLIFVIFIVVIPALIHLGYEAPQLEKTIELEPFGTDISPSESYNEWYVVSNI